MTQKKNGFVWFVGAGPGAADLITVRGLTILKRADVVLYDSLVEPELLELTDSRKLHVGKRCGRHNYSQEEISSLMVREAWNGHRVVRLKGGDPAVFGRLGEEVDALRKYGIPFEIIPGVSSVTASVLACGLSLTKRGIADSFCVVTGKKADSDEPLTIPTYDPRQTIVILMGVRNFASIRKSMSEQGYPMDIPLCFISRAGRKDASYIHTNLGSANKKVDALKDAAPTIILVGHIAQDLETEIDYFSPESMGNSPRLWTEPDKTGIKVSSPT